MKTLVTFLLAFCLASSAHAIDVRIDGVPYGPIVDAGPVLDAGASDAGTPPVVDPPVPARGKFAANFPKLEDYGVRVFSDLTLTGRPWVDLNAGWATAKVTLDSNGWPTSIPSNMSLASILSWDAGAKEWPAGTYVVSGSIACRSLRTQTGRNIALGPTFSYTPATDGGLMLVLSCVNGAPISIKPQAETGRFNPALVAVGKNFSGFRYMDAQKTNNSLVTSNPTPDTYFSFAAAPAGISLEAIAEFSRLTGTDVWINMPALATDAFVVSSATRLKAAGTAPGARVFVELGNENWSGQFKAQSQFGSTFATSWQASNKRAAVVGRLFKEVYGASAIRVCATQSANYGTATLALSAVPKGSFDALAVAPYFAGDLKTVTGDSLISSVDQTIKDMVANFAIAKLNGVQLIAYEGGPHLMVANTLAYSTEMGRAMAKYLAGWSALGAGPLFLYDLAEHPGTTMSWGLLRTLNPEDTANPRYQAVMSAGK